MSIKTGRYGTISWDPVPASPVNPIVLVSLNKWKLSLKTDKQKVTCYGDLNHVYVPGMKDISGAINGFWNSDHRDLFTAGDAETPGWLSLAPNSTETAAFSGLAYLDADIDCSVDGPPAISSSIMAGGPWSLAA